MLGKRKRAANTEPRRRQQQRQLLSSLEVESELFRRNRTLTGSTSSSVSSVSENRGALKSPRVETHELVRKQRHLGGLLFFTIAIITILALLTGQFTAGVRVAVNETYAPGDTSRYERLTESYLGGRPIERLRWLLNLNQLTDYLHSHAPEVDAVTAVSPAGIGQSTISLTLRKPIVSWQINGKRYFVDVHGVSFTQYAGEAPGVEIIDKSGVELLPGSAVASNRFLSYVGRTVALAGNAGVSVKQVIIPSGSTREIELHMTDYPYPVYVSIDRAVGEQVEDMVRAMTYFKEQSITPEYIDVRVSGKAYYRD